MPIPLSRLCGSFLLLWTLYAVTLAGTLAETGAWAESPVTDDDGFLSADQLRGEGFRPLFVGEDLAHWDVQPGHVGHWRIADDRVLHYDGQATQKKSFDKSLWTKDSFGDLELYVEWRLPPEPRLKPHPIVLWNGDFLLDDQGKRVTRPRLDAGDSGIYFRGHFPCQANIWSQELGSGEINGYRTDKRLPVKLRQSCLPFRYADRPLGQWNAFRIELVDDAMTVNLNGHTVLQSDPLPDLPATGPIGLQHHGDEVEFRNIWIKRR